LALKYIFELGFEFPNRDAEGCGGVALGVNIHDQDSLLMKFDQTRSEIVGGGGLADTAFHIEDGEFVGHSGRSKVARPLYRKWKPESRFQFPES
jgi:hypothetical protein